MTYSQINADIESGFNYPFILYIPNGIDKSQINNLLLHSCNTPYGMIDYKSVEEFTISCQLDPNSLQFSMVNSGKIPLIMPIIPRFIGYNPEYIEDGVQKSNIETFIKMQRKSTRALFFQLFPKVKLSSRWLHWFNC